MVAEAITVAAELKIMTVKEIKTLLLELHLVTHQIQQIIPTEIIPILQEQKATLTEIITTHLLDPTLQVHLAMEVDTMAEGTMAEVVEPLAAEEDNR
jgi:hypothetical protein